MGFPDGGGVKIDPDIIFRASVGMLDTKDFVYAIASGLVGDLSVSAGMAGDDGTAHSFATKYEPAAATIVQGISSAGQAVGLTASKLLAMAVDYLNADRKSAADITGQVDVDSFAQPPQPDCEPQQISAQLPMVTGSKQVHEIPIVGKFWPQGDPDRLRKAGDVWHTAAGLVDKAQINAGQHAEPIPIYCSSGAVTAFTKYVTQIYDPDPSGGSTLADGQPLMENLSAACRQMSAACHDYADAIDTCRHTIEALAIGAGIITAVGIIGTIFTLGGSDAAAAAGDGAIGAEAAAAADALAAAEADSVAAAAVAEAEEVLSSALARLTLAGVITAATVAGATALSSSDAYAMPSPATVPPLPPIPASGKFPPYTPAQQAAALAWENTLDTSLGLSLYAAHIVDQEGKVPSGLGR